MDTSSGIVPQRHRVIPIAIAMLAQFTAAISAHHLYMASILSAASEFNRSADFGDRVAKFVGIVWLGNGFFILGGWPVIGIASWILYFTTRSVRWLLWLSSVPYIQSALIIAFLMIVNWLFPV